MTRVDEIFREMRYQAHRSTDRIFLWLLLAQWLFAIVLAIQLSLYTWTAAGPELHIHVKMAIGFGAALNALPIALILTRPGWWGTRQVIAAAQMTWSALIIMLSGGRIETHFHVFGSLAFLAFYRDWKVLATGTLAVIIDHLARGLWWPDSVYGSANPEWWRFLEHVGWVVFEDIVLLLGCARSVREMRHAAEREAELEANNSAVEHLVERRTAELTETVERYRALVETTAAIPFEYEPATGRLPYIAPQAARMLDCDLADFADTGFVGSLLHEDDRDRVMGEIAKLVAGEHPNGIAIDYRLNAKSGRPAYVRTMMSCPDGQILRGVMLDVTKQKLLELELQHAQKLESVGRLAAGVAHEINTPVQFVSDSVRFVRDGVADLSAVVDQYRELTGRALAGQPADELAKEIAAAETDVDFAYMFREFPIALDRALEGLGRVAAIVRSMKEFAHPDGGERSAVDLNAAVESTLTIARNEYKYVADVITELGELPLVVCHAGEINQVILNIVVNAAHAIADRKGASEERGVITVSTRVDGDNAAISIRDTGGGIPDAIRNQIFDPFFTTKSVGRGTGQGLAIARSIVVDKHRGALTFDTAPGEGTTFHIVIPISQVAPELAA